MFGLIAQVYLWDKNNPGNPKVFVFDETEQHGEKSNNTRIVFHTNHSTVKESWHTAQVQLYNLNDTVWNWITQHGGNWQDGNLNSNLYLSLRVGWSNFGDKSALYKIFEGCVNGFWVERQGRDNVFNFSCGMLPQKNNNERLKTVTKTPQSAMVLSTGETREQQLKEKFLAFLAQGYAFDKLGIQQSFVNPYEWLQEQVLYGKIKLRIDTTTVDTFGDEQYLMEKNAWLKQPIAKSIGTDPDAWKGLKDFLTAEGAMYVSHDCETVYDELGKAVNPVFVLKIRLGRKLKISKNTPVPPKNIIVNYEMLTQDPVATPIGVELHSLMRPWIDVEDIIMLKIITSDKDLKDANGINPMYARPEMAYTLNMSNRSEYVMTQWGQKSIVYEETIAANLNQKRNSASIFNLPLQVASVQHLGDTHGKNWHSLIQTWQPTHIWG